MAFEVNNKEINSQCAELLVRPTYNVVNMNDEKKEFRTRIEFILTTISIS